MRCCFGWEGSDYFCHRFFDKTVTRFRAGIAPHGSSQVPSIEGRILRANHIGQRVCDVGEPPDRGMIEVGKLPRHGLRHMTQQLSFVRDCSLVSRSVLNLSGKRRVRAETERFKEEPGFIEP